MFFYYKSAIKNNIAQVNIHTNPPQLNSQEQYSDQRIFMSNTQTNMLNSYEYVDGKWKYVEINMVMQLCNH